MPQLQAPTTKVSVKTKYISTSKPKHQRMKDIFKIKQKPKQTKKK